MKQKRTPDFSGWATKYGIKCTDGRTILNGAFSDMDGKKVPIVYGHIHDDPDMILGHAMLYSKPEGIWAEGYFNNNPKAASTKEALRLRKSWQGPCRITRRRLWWEPLLTERASPSW